MTRWTSSGETGLPMSCPTEGESRGAAFMGVTHVAGTNYGAICPTNLSRVDESVSGVPCVEAAETLRSDASVTQVGGTPDLMTQVRDA